MFYIKHYSLVASHSDLTDLCYSGLIIDGAHRMSPQCHWSHQTELCLGVSSLQSPTPGAPGLSPVATHLCLVSGCRVGAQQGCINNAICYQDREDIRAKNKATIMSRGVFAAAV